MLDKMTVPVTLEKKITTRLRSDRVGILAAIENNVGASVGAWLNIDLVVDNILIRSATFSSSSPFNVPSSTACLIRLEGSSFNPMFISS